MPVLGPATAQVTIGSLAPSVARKVENRTNDMAMIYEWIVDALIEITTDQQLRNDLIELEQVGPLFSLTAGQQEYDQSLIVNTSDVNMATVDWLIWIDYPTNNIRIKLIPSHYQETDKFMVVNSLPVKWYRYAMKMGLYPIPDKPYQTQARYLRFHPINWTSPQDTVILLSQNWYEIIKLAAAERGFLELEEYEKAESIGKLLRGDPKNPDKPGLLYGRKTQREREFWRSEQRLAPLIRGYTVWPRG